MLPSLSERKEGHREEKNLWFTQLNTGWRGSLSQVSQYCICRISICCNLLSGTLEQIYGKTNAQWQQFVLYLYFFWCTGISNLLSWKYISPQNIAIQIWEELDYLPWNDTTKSSDTNPYWQPALHSDQAVGLWQMWDSNLGHHPPKLAFIFLHLAL